MPDLTSPHDRAQAWFAKGDGDLRSARLLVEADPAEPDAAAFHSQQAAEKYLKGFLVYHGVEPPRTHDLIVLLDLIAPLGAALDTVRARLDARGAQ